MRPVGSLVALGVLLVMGCSSAQSGRMNAYLSPELRAAVDTPDRPARLLPEGLKAGLLLVNDTTDANSAPPLSAARRALMEDLVREQLEGILPIEALAVVPPATIPGALDRSQLHALGRRHKVELLVFAVLSSRDDEAPTHLGQGYMMTQMPGVTVVNRAVMEIALLDANAGRLLLQARGHGSETLEELDVPLGSGQPDRQEARDILRVNAGKQALDRAFLKFRNALVRLYPH